MMNQKYSNQLPYQLSDILAAGVGLNGITSKTTLPPELSQHHERWQRFTSGLSTIRYARQDSYPFNLDEIFKESFFWLKHWP